MQQRHTHNLFIIVEIVVDSVEKLKVRLPSLEIELKDQLRFKDFYHFTFNYAKNPGQKGLDLDMALAYWNIVLQGKFRFLDLWCKFLQVGARVSQEH
uniref:Defective in cullin neddylation protein n=1 Tax=Timema poppense TaxID=170557 RepID=A0A7R9HAY5_TIMPO|nr:unnamed protein product [Timema poppensis]